MVPQTLSQTRIIYTFSHDRGDRYKKQTISIILPINNPP